MGNVISLKFNLAQHFGKFVLVHVFATIHFAGLLFEPVNVLLRRVEEDAFAKVHIIL